MPIYTVQKHDASHLHYDFRLEIDGVLKSWAIPKGPSMNPKEKRLAIETGDHSLSYKNFEGIISEGYGKGTVMLWDKGSFRNLQDISMDKSYSKGHINVKIKGKKLKGEFSLVKMRGKQRLLIKKKDEFASAKSIVKNEPNSVKSGKSLEEIR